MLAELDLTGIGAAGIFIAMVLKMVFDFVSKKNGRGYTPSHVYKMLSSHIGTNQEALKQVVATLSKQSEALSLLVNRVEDLHVWHAPDSSGKQNWKWNMEDAIRELRISIDELAAKVSAA